MLAALVLWVASQGLPRARVAHWIHNLFTTLLLEPETDTLSLAKFQLYCWMSAIIC
jgi:hypothetical protein